MCTIALIGADGAGKTTIGRRLESESGLPVKYIYMGISPKASNKSLPSTRLIAAAKRAFGKGDDMAGPPDPTRRAARSRRFHKRVLGGIKATVRLLLRLSEEWYRQLIVWSYERQGYIVLFDRHFYSDYYAHDIANPDPGRPLTSRLHGFLLNHLYPRPDLLIFLDAPASVLYARKGEGSIPLLERRRQEYLQLRDHVKHFVVVDATQAEDAVLREVVMVIERFSRQCTPLVATAETQFEHERGV